MCPSFVGGVSAGRFLEAGLLGPGCEQRVPDGYRWPVCPEPYFMPVWHMGSAPSELLIFADLRFWVSLNTLSVGKNFFCIFFCIFSVKCLFISFTSFSFFLGFLSLGLSVVYMLGQVTLCCRYFSQFVSCLLSYKCFWPCGLFYFNCCASLSVVVFAPGFWSTCPEVKESLTPVFCYLLLSFIYLRLCSIWGLLQYVWCNLWISFCLLPNGHSFIPGPVIEKSIIAPWLETESRSSLGPLMHLFFPSCRLQACGAEVMPTHPTVPRARPAGLEASSLQGVLWGQVPRPGWDSGLPWWLFLRLCRIIAVPDSVSCNTVLSVSVWAPVTSTWPSVLHVALLWGHADYRQRHHPQRHGSHREDRGQGETALWLAGDLDVAQTSSCPRLGWEAVVCSPLRPLQIGQRYSDETNLLCLYLASWVWFLNQLIAFESSF